MSQLPRRCTTGYQHGIFVAENLPPRQAQTLLLMATGHGEKESAEVMNCSIANIRQLKQALYLRLETTSPTEAIALAFAKTHLRVASLLVAILLGFTAPTVNDHDAVARISRTRPNNQLRARTNGKTKTSNGIYWSPDTNELVWS